MNDEPRTHSVVWYFLRTNCVRIAMGLGLACVLSVVVAVWMGYQREQRIAQRIRELGGTPAGKFHGPNWIPETFRDHLWIFERFDYVNARLTQISDVDLEHLATLNHVRTLGLSHTQITDKGLQSVSHLTDLRLLDLTVTSITDAGLRHLERLPNLEVLDLESCKDITDTGLQHIGRITSLRRLTLSNTRITDAGLKHLAGLQNLHDLELNETLTTPEGRNDLRKAIPICGVLPVP